MSYEIPPQRQQVDVSAGTAFKFGFFSALGAFIASLIISAVGFVVLLLISVILGSVISSQF